MTELRTFDTSGTTLQRSGKVFTITCVDDNTSNRVATQLRTEAILSAAQPVAWSTPIATGRQLTSHKDVADRWRENGLQVEPLYPAAQPPELPQPAYWKCEIAKWRPFLPGAPYEWKDFEVAFLDHEPDQELVAQGAIRNVVKLYAEVPPAAPVEIAQETCFDCGVREHCDEDCPNHVEPEPVPSSSIETDRLDWQTASEKDCCDALYQIGGALRRGGNFDLAQDAERIADALYPGKLKPAPIVPRTTT